MNALKRFFTVLLAGGLFSCASSTTFISSDPKAEVYIDPQAREIGELGWRDRQPFWGGVDVQVYKVGCETKFYHIPRSGDLSVSAFLLLPLTFGLTGFWITRYSQKYDLAFECKPLAKGAL